jgi:transposase-like protein
MRDGGKVPRQSVLIVSGIDWANVLKAELANREKLRAERSFPALRERGSHTVQLVISDDHPAD